MLSTGDTITNIGQSLEVAIRADDRNGTECQLRKLSKQPGTELRHIKDNIAAILDSSVGEQREQPQDSWHIGVACSCIHKAGLQWPVGFVQTRITPHLIALLEIEVGAANETERIAPTRDYSTHLINAIATIAPLVDPIQMVDITTLLSELSNRRKAEVLVPILQASAFVEMYSPALVWERHLNYGLQDLVGHSLESIEIAITDLAQHFSLPVNPKLKKLPELLRDAKYASHALIRVADHLFQDGGAGLQATFDNIVKRSASIIEIGSTLNWPAQNDLLRVEFIETCSLLRLACAVLCMKQIVSSESITSQFDLAYESSPDFGYHWRSDPMSTLFLCAAVEGKDSFADQQLRELLTSILSGTGNDRSPSRFLGRDATISAWAWRNEICDIPEFSRAYQARTSPITQYYLHKALRDSVS